CLSVTSVPTRQTAPEMPARSAAQNHEWRHRLLRKLQARQDETLRKAGKGSYRVVLENRSMTHAGFGDLPLLQARDRAEAEKCVRVLGVVRSYTRASLTST